MYERCSVVQKSTGRQCVLDEGHEEKGLDVHSTIIRPTSPFRYIERARMDGRRLPKSRHRDYCELDLDHIGRCQPRYMALLGLKKSPSKPNYSGDSIATEPVGNSVPVSPAMGLWTYYVDTAQIEKRLVYDYETASQSGTRTGRWSYFDAYNPKGHSLLGMPYGKKEQELWHLKFVLTELAKTLDIESLKKLNTEMVEILQTQMVRAEERAQDLASGFIPTKYQWSFGVVRPRTPQTPSTDGAVVGTDGLMYELPSQVGYCHTKWHTIEPHEMNNNCQGWQPKKKSIGSFYL
jgi:hypothetical protein